ncbi:MAG: ATP-binding protein [Egibacteraceae bacterium]
MTATVDPSLRHLLGRMAAVEARVRAAVGRRREQDPAPDDPFRGLYLSDEQADRLLRGPGVPLPVDDAALAEVERAADADEAAGADLRLRRLARSFGLQPVDVELLLIALAPDLDSRLERLYGYLNDDVTLRRATVGLALDLCGASPASADLRRRVSPASALVAGGLLLVEDTTRPFLTRSLRVPDRVTAHLLGDDRPEPVIAPLLELPAEAGAVTDLGLGRALQQGARLCYLRDCPGGSARAVAAAGLAAVGQPPLCLDLGRVVPDDDVAALARAAALQARLGSGGLVAGPIEALAERGVHALRTLAECGAPPGSVLAELPVPVVLTGRASWDTAWSGAVPLLIDVPVPGSAQRAGVWRASLNGDAPHDLDGATLTTQFVLTPEQVSRAVEGARLQAGLTGDAVTVAHLHSGARAQNAAGLERLARRIEPAVGWDDLVLPPGTLAQLGELAGRARHRDRVLHDWGMRPGGGRGRGITGLFAGDSGTGKTMSAEVIAAELGLDLYAVNLATVVDKYVGETEKNLERIFTEAAGVNGVLLFDEADAIFGKRSEVRDAHDRYANIETAYLLQRMESFDGLAILATNLRANVDEAFTRRLDAIIDFPRPDERQRRQLWERCLGALLPRAEDLDLDFCARAFELSGGNIRSIAVTAAYLVAGSGRLLSMADLVHAVQREYRKLGRLCLEAEFGPYHALLT